MAVKIGLLSDTHGWLDEKLLEFFEGCGEVWHCGDWGDVKVSDALVKHFQVRGVYGNIDGMPLKYMYPEIETFELEKIKVVMTHIGGYPGHYERGILPVLESEHPKLFVCGHSHIAKVMYDKKLDLLHINPGAAGRYGFHKVRTAVRFLLDNGDIKNLELIELNKS
ncbi:MAG: metallophosphatase family protein [Culturomica sp.]|jgi:putative phosphoesterase|nr:metallophosphatase family protein [Culturomica sp.]